MSRKAFVVLLVVMLVIPFGAQISSAQEPAELTFVFWNWGADAQPGWEKIFTEFAVVHPEITINLLPVEGVNWGEYLEGTATLIAGGERPDVMWVATEGTRLLVELELALPLDDFIAADEEALAEFFADVEPAMVDAFNVDGKQYMLPYSWNSMVIYYNTARLAEAGLEPPSPDWTRDDFLAMAQALTVDENNDGTPEKYGFAWPNDGLFTSAIPWIFANGGNILTEDYCGTQLDSPEVTEALQFMYDMIYTYKVAPDPIGYGDIFNLFQTGDIAMFGAGRWPLANIIPAGFTDFDIQLWPGNPDRITEFGIDGFPILATTQNPEAAWELVKFLTGASVQQGLVGSEESPVTNIPARRSVAAHLNEFPPANASAFYESLAGPSRLVPAPGRFNEMENIFLRYTGLIFADEMTVEEAMQAATDELASVVTCK